MSSTLALTPQTTPPTAPQTSAQTTTLTTAASPASAQTNTQTSAQTTTLTTAASPASAQTSTQTSAQTTAASAAQTVRQIALQQPTSIRVFEHFGIDYCCGGNQPLADICAQAHLDLAAVLLALDAATGHSPLPSADWSQASLELLCAHILTSHHAYVRRELPRLLQLAEKVSARHGSAHAELTAIDAALSLLELDLNEHFPKEESLLFPYIVTLERSVDRSHHAGEDAPASYCGFLATPLAIIADEHQEATALLDQLRQLTQNFTPPPNACPSYRALYDGLRELDEDLRQHIHLESEILFPRAILLEASTCAIA
jgi:regulator of cell morphogenesis and NO signaling